MDAGKHSPAQVPQLENLSRIEESEIEPQQVSTKFVDVDKWIKESATDQAAADAEAAARAAERDSKKVTPVSSQVDDEKYVNSPATNSPAPTTVARPSDPSEVMTAPAAAILLGDINWVGKLHEYRAVKPSPVPLSFVESTHSFGFSCTVVLPESSNHFGGPERRFLRKKDAKQNAAKDAVTWLAENGHINANYSIRKTGPPTEASSISAPSSAPGGASLSSSTATTSGNSQSYAQMIPGLCNQLGFSPPTYMLTLAPGATAIYSGYAHFPGDPRITGHVGEFTNIYGRKNAKEVCAKEVFKFLKDIERLRTEQFQDATGKRKRNDDDLPENNRDWEDTRSIKTLVQDNSHES